MRTIGHREGYAARPAVMTRGISDCPALLGQLEERMDDVRDLKVRIATLCVVEPTNDTDIARSTQLLDDVDEALRRIGNGTYATCEDCGAEIDSLRLEQFPTARSCGNHPQLADQLREQS